MARELLPSDRVELHADHPAKKPAAHHAKADKKGSPPASAGHHKVEHPHKPAAHHPKPSSPPIESTSGKPKGHGSHPPEPKTHQPKSGSHAGHHGKTTGDQHSVSNHGGHTHAHSHPAADPTKPNGHSGKAPAHHVKDGAAKPTEAHHAKPAHKAHAAKPSSPGNWAVLIFAQGDAQMQKMAFESSFVAGASALLQAIWSVPAHAAGGHKPGQESFEQLLVALRSNRKGA
jgi:hypothetical protein